MRVAVAGGTGLTGRHVVESLTRTGHEPVVLSRSTGVDLVSGVGLAATRTFADYLETITGGRTAGVAG